MNKISQYQQFRKDFRRKAKLRYGNLLGLRNYIISKLPTEIYSSLEENQTMIFSKNIEGVIEAISNKFQYELISNGAFGYGFLYLFDNKTSEYKGYCQIGYSIGYELNNAVLNIHLGDIKPIDSGYSDNLKLLESLEFYSDGFKRIIKRCYLSGYGRYLKEMMESRIKAESDLNKGFQEDWGLLFTMLERLSDIQKDFSKFKFIKAEGFELIKDKYLNLRNKVTKTKEKVNELQDDLNLKKSSIYAVADKDDVIKNLNYFSKHFR